MHTKKNSWCMELCFMRSLFKGHKGMHNQPTILQRLIQLKVTLAVLFLLFFFFSLHISLFTWFICFLHFLKRSTFIVKKATSNKFYSLCLFPTLTPLSWERIKSQLKWISAALFSCTQYLLLSWEKKNTGFICSLPN